MDTIIKESNPPILQYVRATEGPPTEEMSENALESLQVSTTPECKFEVWLTHDVVTVA